MNEHHETLRPTILRPTERTQRRTRPETPIEAQTAVAAENGEPVRPLALSTLAIMALVGLGLAAVEAVRIGLIHEILSGIFGNGGGTLPFAAVLTIGLCALDAGMLIRLFAPATAGGNGSLATWASIGAWLVVTTANSVLIMFALAGMMDPAHSLIDVAPVGVAIVLLLLRVLLVGSLAWDAKDLVARGAK